MTTPSDTHPRDYIARVAPRSEFPESAGPGNQNDRAPRPVQPGFEDAAPGMVPRMKANPGPELREEPGGRFAKQLAEAPDGGAEDASGQGEKPGPRNPAPEPPTNAEGYVAIPSVEDAAGGAVADDPQPPPAAGEGQSRRRAEARPNPAAV